MRMMSDRERDSLIRTNERETELFWPIAFNKWTDIWARTLGPTQNVCVYETNYVEAGRQTEGNVQFTII
jgi:hypothetical protein